MSSTVLANKEPKWDTQIEKNRNFLIRKVSRGSTSISTMFADGKADLLTFWRKNGKKFSGSRMKKAGLGIHANHEAADDHQGLSKKRNDMICTYHHGVSVIFAFSEMVKKQAKIGCFRGLLYLRYKPYKASV